MQGTIKLKELNQATKSAEMENYELEFRQKLKTKIECLAISKHRSTDTEKKVTFFKSNTSLQLYVSPLGTQRLKSMW